MYPILFKIGPVTIYTYGVCIFLGVILGYFVCLKEAEKEGVDKNVFSDIIFWALIFSFIGARLLYILVEFKTFLKDPISLLFARSGFVFYGGVIFGFISSYLLTKKRGVNFLKFADIAAIGIPLGHCLGRLGCFFYGCCYGRPTSSFAGVLFPPASPAGLLAVKVIPTQLISSFFLFLIFLILIFLKKRKKFDGQILFSYFLFYGIFRFIIGFFRADPRGGIYCLPAGTLIPLRAQSGTGEFFLSTSQFLSLGLIVLSIFMFRRLLRKKIKWKK